MADEEFTVTEEYCRNARRDYFIGYEVHLPEHLHPGKHTLQLTIEDLEELQGGAVDDRVFNQEGIGVAAVNRQIVAARSRRDGGYS